MNVFKSEPSDFTPKVLLDPVSQKFEISGESRPENAGKFFAPIIQWFEQYRTEIAPSKNNGKPFVIEFRFDYLNSVSAKFMMDIFRELDLYNKDGINVVIKWYYDRRDEDMRSTGEEFADLMAIPFEFIAF